METAYNQFNAGKYKEAFNLLNANVLNIDSYEPNLAICEYLSNRCQQSSINCHRKLNDWLRKKFKRENYKLECQTETVVKFNIAVLLILLGKRDNALLLMHDIFVNRGCFIEFMQSRILLLLMELNINLRNSADVLTLFCKYPLKPADNRNQSSQWISLLLHEHNKSSNVCNEQFHFLSRVFLNQSLMQLGVSQSFLQSPEEDAMQKNDLIERIKKRKNSINKYYEINVTMISHFFEAQRQLYTKNYVKCLELMNFANIQNEYEQMPSTKIITNILNALTTSNIGIVNLAQNKPHLSLSQFLKAKTLLSKGCTGVQDKDLQLFSINYANHSEAITYNMALSMLASQSKDAYSLFESFRKSNPNVQNYKYWYRAGQSVVEHYHQNAHKLTPEKTQALLEQALECFICSLNLLDKNTFPSEKVFKYLAYFLRTNYSEEEYQLAHINFKGQVQTFRKSIVVVLCYLYNCLEKYEKTVLLAQEALFDEKSNLSGKLRKDDQLKVIHYLMEAFVALDREKDCERTFSTLKKQTNSIKDVRVAAAYSEKIDEILKINYEDLMIYQTALWYLKTERLEEAASLIQNLRQKAALKPNYCLKKLMRYLHIQMGLDSTFVSPYLK